jgi:hypothetical protein
MCGNGTAQAIPDLRLERDQQKWRNRAVSEACLPEAAGLNLS